MIDDDKNIFITTLAFIKVEKIDRDEFKWLSGDDVSQWRSCLTTRFLVFETDTFSQDIILSRCIYGQ